MKKYPFILPGLKASIKKHCVHKHLSALKAGYSSFKIFIDSSFPLYLGLSFLEDIQIVKVLLNFHLQNKYLSGILFWKKEDKHFPLPALLKSIFSFWNDCQCQERPGHTVTGVSSCLSVLGGTHSASPGRTHIVTIPLRTQHSSVCF